MKFVRYGGLSSVNQKVRYKAEDFHAPPAKRGIYCFHPEFIEPFLYYWKKDKKELDSNRREFEYNGEIWTHMFIPKYNHLYTKRHGSWYLTNTSCLKQIISKYIASENKDILTWMGKYANKFGDNHSIYKRNGNKDAMELFIEKV